MTGDKNKYDKYYPMWQEIKDIINSSNFHLKEITAQLHNYDIHDDTHSNKVLENIELLLGDDGINNLTFYELILLYSCVFYMMLQWHYQDGNMKY